MGIFNNNSKNDHYGQFKVIDHQDQLVKMVLALN